MDFGERFFRCADGIITRKGAASSGSKSKLECNTVHAYIHRMETLLNSTRGNRTKLEQVETALAELLAETLRRGFHGKAVLELAIQDGTIQHLRRIVERIEI